MDTDIHAYVGISADAGATFGGDVNIVGTGNYLQFPDGTTMGTSPGLTHGVSSFNGLAGAVDITGSMLHIGGLSSDGGATFGGDVNILGGVSAAGATIDGYWAGEQIETIGISVNNGSRVLTTGVKGHRTIPYACDIIDWRVTSTDSGAIEWGLNYATYANFPTMTAIGIHGSESPGIAASGTKDESGGNIAGGTWTPYQFDAGTIIEFEIDSVTTLTNCIIELTIRRNG
jgi:hypothetical protein